MMFISESGKEKLARIKEGGLNNLHIVSDFDRTLTPHRVQGEKTSTSFAQFRNGGYLGDDYVSRAEALYDKYRPLEIDESLSFEERNRHMKEWFRLHMELLVEKGVTRDILEDIVRRGRVRLRDGANVFLQYFSSKQVPVLLLSAGIGDLIRIFLQSQDLLAPNVHIISNFFEFDEAGRALGVKGDSIAPTNKDESGVADSVYGAEVDARNNVIVLGDNVDDIKMVHGLEHDTVLSVGFLNENEDTLREPYRTVFDIVIESDGSMEELNQMIFG